MCGIIYVFLGSLVLPHGESLRVSSTQRICSSEAEYIDGTWVLNKSITTMSYTSDPHPPWHTPCDKIQASVLAGGQIPDYMRYQWIPKSCELAPFDREALCRSLDGKVIGVAGDSTSHHFKRTLEGLMLGHIPRPFADIYGPHFIELCPKSKYSVQMYWHRHNNWADIQNFSWLAPMLFVSDFVVFNWGPHYARDNIVNESLGSTKMSSSSAAVMFKDIVSNLKDNVEQYWLPLGKPSHNIFWRASIGYHENCDENKGPYGPPIADHDPRIWTSMHNVANLYDQERQIVWPAMRNLGATILRTDAFTMLRPDGHRGNGDCLHYCEPGVPDTWGHLFYNYVMGHIVPGS